MSGLDGVRQYQWLQLGVDGLRLDLVSATALTADQVRAMERALHDACGAFVRFAIRYVDAIARAPSGKHRFVIGPTA